MKKSLQQLLISSVISLGLVNTIYANDNIIKTAQATPTSSQIQQKASVEVVFVLDTTGSMESLIEGAKKKIWSIANTIIDINPNAEIRMALIAYRDRGDDYVVKTMHDLNTDVQRLYSVLVQLNADGGGDHPESVNEALDKGVNQIQWTNQGKNIKRILFLVGDAPPHMDYIDEKKYPAILQEAVAKGIIVNTVQAGNDVDTTQVWKQIAKQGKGSYLSIPQDGGQIIQISTPYDDEILDTQDKLDQTVLIYGNSMAQAEITNKMAVRKSASKETQADNASFYAKKSVDKVVISGSGDLISDIKNNKVRLEELKEQELPNELQNKSTKEKQTIIENTLKKRQSLESHMTELVKKRDDYLKQQASNVSNTKDSFDNVVKETLEKQLAP